MKKSIIRLLVLVCTIMFFVNSAVTAVASNKIRLVIWSFTNEFLSMIEKYYAENHPEIEFEFQIYPTDGNAYTTRLDSMFRSNPTSSEAPDIIVLEAAFVKKYVNSNSIGNLKDVGFTDEELSDSFTSTAQVGQNSVGDQKGLSWQSTPGVLMYRASLAEKYLGVKTPAEMQQKVNSWETFLATARELKEKSDGACKMVCGLDDLWKAYQYCRSQGWVTDNTLNIDATLLSFEDFCKALEQEDLTQKAGSWGETWFAGMRGENETLCYFLPTWGLYYTLKPNCVAGWDAENPDSEENIKNATENGTYGDWRITLGPNSYMWGGTWIGTNAAKVAAADDAKKAAIHDLIYFFTLDQNFQTQYAADANDFINSMTAAESIVSTGGKSEPFLGGQEPYAIFAQVAKEAAGSLMTEYDEYIEDLWKQYVTIPYSKGEKDLEECIADFREAVTSMYSDFTISDIPTKLQFLISQSGYEEDFIPESKNKYFVMPLGSDAQLSLSGINFGDSDEAAYEVTGNTIQISGNTISAVNTGLSVISAWVVSEGEEVDSSRITANVLVVDSQKTVQIPSSATWLESEAFKGINAECVIIPSSVWVIENGCFSNCPNLNTVIWIGDPSSASVKTPFNSTDSILFLSGSGQLPKGLTGGQTGITGFGGF